MSNPALSKKQREELLRTLHARFEKNMNRHKGLEWAQVQARLEANAEKLWSLNEMERTGGESDVVGHDQKTGESIFYDCSAESPKGRRSLCYDREALDSRKEHKPKDNALDMAAAMGIQLLTEEQYRELQQVGNFDTKTSSWVKTPSAVRELGGALFCDRRYNTVFLYHNGAESYYAARGLPWLVAGLSWGCDEMTLTTRVTVCEPQWALGQSGSSGRPYQWRANIPTQAKTGLERATRGGMNMRSAGMKSRVAAAEDSPGRKSRVSRPTNASPVGTTPAQRAPARQPRPA
jgi:hypothetical protein